jgi:DNA-binding CsgD family transcriptional regulator
VNCIENPIRQFSSSTVEMKKLTIPLTQRGILHFSMIRSYDDGRFINLSNIDGWIDYYYKMKLYLSSCFENHPSTYFSQVYLWGNKLDGKVVDDAKKYFNSANGVTIIDRGLQCTSFYFFSSSLKQAHLDNFYINNLSFLYQFLNQFEKAAKNVIANSIINQREYIYDVLYVENPLADNISVSERVGLKPLFGQKEDFTNPLSLDITPRESDCLSWLLKGFAAKEIAKVECLSPRTVEQHLDSIKRKLKCRTSLELVSKLFTSHHHFTLSLLHANYR